MCTEDSRTTNAQGSNEAINARDLAQRIQLGEFVRREMKDRKWRQLTLAEKVGCDQTTISKIINGKQRASESITRRLLEAFELPSNYLETLPSAEFEPGSDGFRLKSLIIGAHLEYALPDDQESCARIHIAQKWSNAEYRDLPRTPNLEDAVWASLVADGYFEIEEGLYLANYEFKGHLRYFLSSYISHACSAIQRIAQFDDLKRAELLKQLEVHLEKYEISLASPQRLIDCVDQINLTLANNDRLIASILRGYTNGLRLFMQTASGVVSTTDQYDSTIKPIMECLLNVLRKAMTELYQPAPNADWHESVNAYVEEMGEAVTGWTNSLKPVDTIADDSEAT